MRLGIETLLSLVGLGCLLAGSGVLTFTFWVSSVAKATENVGIVRLILLRCIIGISARVATVLKV